jgi:hypothetical protein
VNIFKTTKIQICSIFSVSTIISTPFSQNRLNALWERSQWKQWNHTEKASRHYIDHGEKMENRIGVRGYGPETSDVRDVIWEQNKHTEMRCELDFFYLLEMRVSSGTVSEAAGRGNRCADPPRSRQVGLLSESWPTEERPIRVSGQSASVLKANGTTTHTPQAEAQDRNRAKAKSERRRRGSWLQLLAVD